MLDDDGSSKNRHGSTTQQSQNQRSCNTGPSSDANLVKTDRAQASVKTMKPELIEDVCEEYSMFGTYIPKIDVELDAKLESLEPKGISNGVEIKGDDDVVYQTDKPLGRYSYRVKQVGQKRWHWLKIQRKDQPKYGPFLRRELEVLEQSRKVKPANRKHFLKLYCVGRMNWDQNTYNYLVLQLTHTNLADAWKELKDIEPALATRLALQSLQAIHDLHLCHFIHRDIRPENFHVGLGPRANLLFITNFDFAFRYFGRPKPKKDKGPQKPLTPRRLPKLPWLSMKYQSRSFHRGSDVHRCDDLESWLYMCVDLFDQSLPWVKSNQPNYTERDVYHAKEAFFAGAYDATLTSVPKEMLAIRNKLDRTPPKDAVNYPLFGHLVKKLRQRYPSNWNDPLLPKKNGSQQNTVDENQVTTMTTIASPHKASRTTDSIYVPATVPPAKTSDGSKKTAGSIKKKPSQLFKRKQPKQASKTDKKPGERTPSPTRGAVSDGTSGNTDVDGSAKQSNLFTCKGDPFTAGRTMEHDDVTQTVASGMPADEATPPDGGADHKNQHEPDEKEPPRDEANQ